jgi:hypothetical protein
MLAIPGGTSGTHDESKNQRIKESKIQRIKESKKP